MDILARFLVAFLHVMMISAYGSDGNFNYAGYQSQYGNGGNGGGISFNSFGGTSQSVFQNGGNSVVISRRMGGNDEVEDYISVSNPKIRIDGDYCKQVAAVCN